MSVIKSNICDFQKFPCEKHQIWICVAWQLHDDKNQSPTLFRQFNEEEYVVTVSASASGNYAKNIVNCI